MKIDDRNMDNWVQLIDNNFLLNSKQMELLEDLRKQYNIQEKDFAFAVMSSSGGSKIIQKNAYNIYKERYPDKSDKDIFKLILRDRFFEKSDTELVELVSNVDSFEDLCDLVVKMDEIETKHYQPNWKAGIVNLKIDEIINKD